MLLSTHRMTVMFAEQLIES